MKSVVTILLLLLGLGSIACAADIPALVQVPAGRYDIGTRVLSGTAGGNAEDQPAVHNFYDLDAYGIGKTEVSNDALCSILNWGLQKQRLRIDKAGVLYGDQVVLDLRSTFCPIAAKGTTLSVRDNLGKYPATEVTWHGAMVYCALLNEKVNLPQAVDLQRWTIDVGKSGFRLPTEVEWEAAALGGKPPGFNKKPARPDGFVVGALLDNVPDGTYNLSSGGEILPCGSLPAHGFGTHDMVGNVWEWCADHYVSVSVLQYAGSRESWDTNGSKKGKDWTLKKEINILRNPVFDAIHRPELTTVTGKFAKTPLLDTEYRVQRGGGWTISGGIREPQNQKFLRRGDRPELSTNDLGFRVARRGKVSN
ncbi:MAG: SUMF1/EgtB/PvdO family nonheme iron enzyme [Planctomycetia bacterium]|nr:SUMF1/EgtB/PvdO family nonheme iron enzyme [Planctomycetia bacterium]